MITEELENSFDAACDFAEKIFDDLVVNTGLTLGEFSELSFNRLMISFHPGIQTKTDGRGHLFYEVDEEVAGFLCGQAQEVPEVSDMVREIAASNTLEGMPLPISLRALAFQTIKGTFPHAKRRGRKPGKGFAKKWLLRETACFVSDAFDLSLTRYDGPTQMSACDAVVLVAQKYGVSVRFDALRDWCNHKDYAVMRQQADALTNFLKDEILRKAGALKVGHPYGAFLELSLVRG